MAKFVGERGTQTVFPAWVFGQKAGNANAGLPSGSEFCKAFDVLPCPGKISVKVEICSAGLDQLGQIVCGDRITHRAVKLAEKIGYNLLAFGIKFCFGIMGPFSETARSVFDVHYHLF